MSVNGKAEEQRCWYLGSRSNLWASFLLLFICLLDCPNSPRAFVPHSNISGSRTSPPLSSNFATFDAAFITNDWTFCIFTSSVCVCGFSNRQILWLTRVFVSASQFCGRLISFTISFCRSSVIHHEMLCWWNQLGHHWPRCQQLLCGWIYHINSWKQRVRTFFCFFQWRFHM